MLDCVYLRMQVGVQEGFNSAWGGLARILEGESYSLPVDSPVVPSGIDQPGLINAAQGTAKRCSVRTWRRAIPPETD
jgi:hypothetical protein